MIDDKFFLVTSDCMTTSQWRCRLQADRMSETYRARNITRSEEHTSELQSPDHLVCRLLLEKKNDRLEAFYDNPNALRDYFRDIGRMVLAAEGRKANDSHADCYHYFCVPEYGTANCRLHFHAVHFMRTLPTGSVDPNFGRRVRNRRQLNSLQNTWPYFFFKPNAVR